MKSGFALCRAEQPQRCWRMQRLVGSLTNVRFRIESAEPAACDPAGSPTLSARWLSVTI